jgi:valyl-tRNA synthetase
MDLWILSRLSATIDVSNKGFEQYEFSIATNVCYTFWLYELCDVYLEYVKPIFQTGSDTAKATSRKTLYTCLELGLKLLSPFMPFITEELFQRLPRADTSVPSICVASYPEVETSPWRDEKIEKDVEFMQKAAKLIRSARSDYNIPNKTKTEAFIVCSDESERETLNTLSLALATLAYCSTITFDEGSNVPTGCAILTVSGQCEIHLVLKGLIEADKEIAKLQKKHDLLLQTVGKLKQGITAADYETKVPVDVQQANKEKIQQSESEIERIIAAMATLKIM